MSKAWRVGRVANRAGFENPYPARDAQVQILYPPPIFRLRLLGDFCLAPPEAGLRFGSGEAEFPPHPPFRLALAWADEIFCGGLFFLFLAPPSQRAGNGKLPKMLLQF